MAWWQRRHSDQSRIKRNAAWVRAWSLAMRRRISGALRATGRRDRGPPFVRRHRRAVELGPQGGEKGQRQQGQGDVAIPALPAADLIIAKPDLLLARFEALFDGPAPPGDVGQRREWGLGRREDDIGGTFLRLAVAGPDQQPMVPGRRLQPGEAHPRPVVQSLALGSRPGREAVPGGVWQCGGEIGRGLLPEAARQHRPQLLVTTDRQYKGPLVLFENPPQATVRAIDRVAHHPGERKSSAILRMICGRKLRCTCLIGALSFT